MTNKKIESKKYRLIKTMIIPAGTIFESIDGTKREYLNGNAECLIPVGKNATASVVIGSVEDCLQWLVPEEEKDGK